MRRGFNPRKFLELANQLIRDGAYERHPRARTAMGRIYYTVFLLALRKLQGEGFRIRDQERIHQFVIETYNTKGLSSIGNGLHQLRERRVDADYHMMVNVSLESCMKCAQLSEYVIQLIEQVKEIK